ncbi:hypothetical protein LPJ66_007069 [Kickxella alabastrina]|uniref:Uncharacterized protein n=1 Tax=Kickxella alabastrina TaxID=61397 RepID=A0ACC1IC82_9FUNG|nr:hypothetical protein LPJ66_007069 [Kickxella alabastrina]
MVLSEQFADSLSHINFSPLISPVTASLADKSEISIARVVPQLHIVASPTADLFNCIVAPIKYACIVGVPWMAHNNAHVDWDQRIIQTRYGSIPEYVPASLQGEGMGPEVAALAYFDVSLQDNLWAVAEMLHALQQAVEINTVGTAADSSNKNTATAHPKATRLSTIYKDRLRDELPEELPPRRPQDPTLELRQDAELQNHAVYRMSAPEL